MEAMKHKRGKIAWIALVVGVLALGFALGGAFSRGGPGGWSESRRGPIGWQQSQQAPQGQQGFQNGPQDDRQGAQGGPGFGRQSGQQGFQDGHGMQGNWERGPMAGHGRGAGFFGGIFGLIGGLFKLVMIGLVIYLLSIIARDRWGKRDKSDRDPPSSPPQEPNTGMTTNL